MGKREIIIVDMAENATRAEERIKRGLISRCPTGFEKKAFQKKPVGKDIRRGPGCAQM